ncbi:MAG: transcriptional regulator, partial [Lachnospiraceae bacterium]|nr:transcriptional regulator [Lachnospiraceae bacterium]
MSAVFIKIFNMCVTASYMMLAVILFRMLLKKAPKWLTCILWALVALRLVFPFSFESMISLIPNDEPVPRDITLSKTPAINSGVPAINNTVNPVILDNFTPAAGDSANPLQVYINLAAIVWLAGILVMIVYALISYLRLKRTVAASIPVKDGVRACDDIKTPFILGTVKPVIYIPSDVDG